jgi:cell division protein FtsB
MVTLTNKDKRIKKLENDLNQEKDTNNVLRKRISDLEKKRKNYLK